MKKIAIVENYFYIKQYWRKNIITFITEIIIISWWLRYEVASRSLLNSRSTISSLSLNRFMLTTDQIKNTRALAVIQTYII